MIGLVDVLIKKRMLTRKILCNAITAFLERDENSCIAPGVRDVITKNGITKRKRYLTDTVDNIHEKYLQTKNLKISRSTFYRHKPFWILKKKFNARNTCLCKHHANYNFLLQRLAHFKFISSSSSYMFIKKFVCDYKNKKCMYRDC